MNALSPAYAAGSVAAMEKFAARRGLLEIRNAVAGGDMARANRLATTPGVLNAQNRAGSQIRDLGAGGEGLATLVAHPKHGVSVRKMYDPNAGVYSDELIRRKAELGNLPGVAKHYGQAMTPQGTPMHFNEFVQGKEVRPHMLKNPSVQKAYQSSLLQAHRGARQQGYRLADTRPANAMLTPQGQVKFIDHMPMQAGELQSNVVARGLRRQGAGNVVPVTDRGAELFGNQVEGYSPNVSSQNKGDFKRYMFTGELPRPPAPAPSTLAATSAQRGLGGPMLDPTRPSRGQGYGAY